MARARGDSRPRGSPAGKSFPVQAYRDRAIGVRHLNEPLADIWREQGVQGLREAAGVADCLATALRTSVTAGGCWIDCVGKRMALFESVPVIGRVLAERLHDESGIDSLEVAANDGRLGDLMRIGKRKLTASPLASRLGRVRRPGLVHGTQPSVKDLVAVDRE